MQLPALGQSASTHLCVVCAPRATTALSIVEDAWRAPSLLGSLQPNQLGGLLRSPQLHQVLNPVASLLSSRPDSTVVSRLRSPLLNPQALRHLIQLIPFEVLSSFLSFKLFLVRQLLSLMTKLKMTLLQQYGKT